MIRYQPQTTDNTVFLSDHLRGAWLVYDSTLPLKRWKRKELVQSLRRQGFSYREILQQIPFSLAKSTVSQWCKHIELTSEQLDRLDQLFQEGSYRNRLLGPKTTQRRRAAEVEAIKAKARAEVMELRNNELWLAGVMLYWAEGSKTQDVGFSNSDPNIIRLAMEWFRDICQVPEQKFRVYLHRHSGQDETAMKIFWSEVARLPLAQFRKSYVKQEGSGHRKKLLYWGTVLIRIPDRNLFHKIQGWIEGYCQLKSGPLA